MKSFIVSSLFRMIVKLSFILFSINLSEIAANQLKIRELEYNSSDPSILEFSDGHFTESALSVTVDIKLPLEKLFVRDKHIYTNI